MATNHNNATYIMKNLVKICLIFFCAIATVSFAQDTTEPSTSKSLLDGLLKEIISVDSTPEAAPSPVEGQQYRNSIKQEDYTEQAQLQGLNKITARTSLLPLTLNQSQNFGNLEVSLHACWHAPIEEEPESKALLTISEEMPGEEKKQVFQGWMFASSPGLSALEHPIYDITLIECQKNMGPSPNKTVQTNY